MSLKAFHLIFITASSALAVGFGIWALRNYLSPDGRAMDMVMAIGSFLAGIGLLVYERYFLKKLKNVSYL
jgi:hypothetical protein